MVRHCVTRETEACICYGLMSAARRFTLKRTACTMRPDVPPAARLTVDLTASATEKTIISQAEDGDGLSLLSGKERCDNCGSRRQASRLEGLLDYRGLGEIWACWFHPGVFELFGAKSNKRKNTQSKNNRYFMHCIIKLSENDAPVR